MSKLALIDKNWTLEKPKSGSKFVTHPTDQELLPGVVEQIARLEANDYRIVVVSNQDGVGMGFKTLEDTFLEFDYLMQLIPEIDFCLFCPEIGFGEYCWQIKPNGAKQVWKDQCLIDKPNHGACGPPIPRSIGCRKPNAGMLQVAMTVYNTFDALMIGDRWEDRQAAKNAGVRFIHAETWREGNYSLYA